MNFRHILKATPYPEEDEKGFIPHRDLTGTHWHKDHVTGKHIYDIPKTTPQGTQQGNTQNKPTGTKPRTPKVKPQKFSNALPAFSNALPPFSNALPTFYNSVPGTQVQPQKNQEKAAQNHDFEMDLDIDTTHTPKVPFGKMITVHHTPQATTQPVTPKEPTMPSKVDLPDIKWAKDNLKYSDEYHEYLKKGVMPDGTTITVLPHLPPRFNMEPNSKEWGGMWEFDHTGKTHIFIETKHYEDSVKANALWAVAHTLRHEHMEAAISKELANKAGFKGKVEEIPDKFGGEAHDLTCERLDGLNEQQYFKQLELEYDHLEGKTKPTQKEIAPIPISQPAAQPAGPHNLAEINSPTKFEKALLDAKVKYHTDNSAGLPVDHHVAKIKALEDHAKTAGVPWFSVKNLIEAISKRAKVKARVNIPHDDYASDDGFMNNEAKKLDTSADPQWATLKPDQKKSLLWYTHHGNDIMNPIVADPKKLAVLDDPNSTKVADTLGLDKRKLSDICNPEKDSEVKKAVKGSIASLDSALKKMSLPEKRLLFRATDLSHFDHPQIKKVCDELKKWGSPENRAKALSSLHGISFTDPCFGSTSISSMIAKTFVGIKESTKVVLEIAAPKGTKGSWIGGKSEHDNEHEFLMPRNTRYTVVGVRHEGSKIHLQVAITT